MDITNELIDAVAKNFFSIWREWRSSQGWTLGPDRPDLKLSPLMVDEWEQLNSTGRLWFQQHAAAVLAAYKQTLPSPEGRPDPKTQVVEAMSLLQKAQWSAAATILWDAAMNEKSPFLFTAAQMAKHGPWNKEVVTRLLEKYLSQ